MSTDAIEPETIPMKHADLFQRLVDPFDPTEVKVRDGRGGRKLQYITPRTAMNRLDRVLGPLNWRDSYRPWGDHALICRLEIRIDGEWISKEGIGGRADMDAADDDDKSAESDAFKRACVKWGIARYLYRDGAPEFVSEPTPTQNVLGGGNQSASAPELPPHNGRAFFGWVKEQGERVNVDLLKYINAWAKLQEFPGRLVDWNGEQVSLGVKECIRKLSSVSRAASPPSPSEPIDTQIFEALPNPPKTGKALFAAVKDLEQEHDISLIKELNDWSRKTHRRKDRMVEWPEDFIQQAWLYVSSIVARHTDHALPAPESPPATLPHHNGNPDPCRELRHEFGGWVEGVVRHVFQIGEGPVSKDQLRDEANRIIAMRTPGRKIQSIADLTNADELRQLIVVAQQRFEEVKQPGNF